MNNIKYVIKRSNRKTSEIKIKEEGLVEVRVPFYITDKEVQKMVESNEEWILKVFEKLSKVEKVDKLSIEEKDELVQKGKRILSSKLEYYSKITGTTFNKVTIKFQKTRWGSCSMKGNLNFNGLIFLMPEEISDYVIVHELCHRREMNHSKDFWRLVEEVIPDYRQRRKWLKDHGDYYMQMI